MWRRIAHTRITRHHYVDEKKDDDDEVARQTNHKHQVDEYKKTSFLSLPQKREGLCSLDTRAQA